MIAACTPAPEPRAAGAVSSAEWREALARTAELKAAAALRPHVQTVRVTMRDGRTGRAFDARGAIAVRPAEALRMILLGPGGATALDVWLTRERYRLVVPALGIAKRGGGAARAAGEEPAPPPIGFLRWWFLAPFEGRPLGAVRDAAGRALMLREADGATVVMREQPGALLLERVLGARREEIRIDGELFGKGAQVAYDDRALAVHVDVYVEAVSRDAADPEAFTDPDATPQLR